MKNKSAFLIKLCLPAFLLGAITAHAQKLPNKQEASVWVPANIKVDGKLTEWGNLQAYNNATEIFYSIANDDENLYLVIKTAVPDVIDKITGGGITWGIKKSGKKDGSNDITITYPVLERKNFIALSLRDRPGISKDSLAKEAGAIMKRNNNSMESKFKSIIIASTKSIDTLSVYNENNIKAASWINLEKVYTQEMSVPLALLGFSKNEVSKFSYHIQINGSRFMATATITVHAGPNVTSEQLAQVGQLQSEVNMLQAKLSAITDFWGEYTLAKKP